LRLALTDDPIGDIQDDPDNAEFRRAMADHIAGLRPLLKRMRGAAEAYAPWSSGFSRSGCEVALARYRGTDVAMEAEALLAFQDMLAAADRLLTSWRDPPRRGRGSDPKDAKQQQKRRIVCRWLRKVSLPGQVLRPGDHVLAEIALGFKEPCGDGVEFRARERAWAKTLKKHPPP
jgi:hypothetical protein